LKKTRALAATQPPICKQIAFMMSIVKLENNYMLDASLVHGAMFLKASLHGLKRKQGGWGRAQPPHLQTQRLYGSEIRVHMGSVLAGRTILEENEGVGGDAAPHFANRLPL